MSRKLKAHPVERLIDGYLSKFAKTSNTRGSKQVMQKAAKLIGIALHNPCCQPAEEVILGLKEDYLLVQLTSMLNGIDARKWRESLERAKVSLENKLDNPCCPPECPSVAITAVIPEISGRDQLTVTFCGIAVMSNVENEPNQAQYVATQLNINKPISLPNNFTFDNLTRSITYEGLACDECENVTSFNIEIAGG